MKLVVQIPCFNEERTLLKVLSEIPKKISGINEIEIQIIDDGSRDKTVEIAKKFHVDRIITHRMNQGLGISFRDGVLAAIRSKADILVNTDGDNQYPGKYIKDLIKPIIDGTADIVVADRKTNTVKHFSWLKKLFQKFGSFVVRSLSGTEVPDALSGFRAYSRKSLLELNVIAKFSYCIDTIVQAGKKGLKIVIVPIKINIPTRTSRMSKNMWEHIFKSGLDLLRVFVVYEPFKTFLYISIIFFIITSLLILEYVFWSSNYDSKGHFQLLIFAGAFFICGIQTFSLGIIAELTSLNRRMIERMLMLQKENVK
jgi:glycosyltransferase involved in cell wall biosynthesis